MKVNIYNTTKTYKIIYADPAWSFNNKKTGGSGKSGDIYHYQTSTLDQMKSIPVSQISDDNSILFMWWVGSQPKEAIELCEYWGFRLFNMNGFVWDKKTVGGKDHFGMGHATRASTESMLIGIKGKISPLIKSHSVLSKISAQVGNHSEKPNEFRQAIVRLCGDVPRIELFARKEFDGWDCHGFEL